MLSINDELYAAAQMTEFALDSWLSPVYSGDTVLAEAMRYATMGGGKRIRGFLTIHFCRMFGGTDAASLPFACAMEMVHAYSLIHDDMPCMDNSDLRRGKPSCHKAYGEANALLAGDTLLTQAFEVASYNPSVSPETVRLAVRELAHGAGALGMAGGQYYDLAVDCSTFDELVRLQQMKTGALIRCACLLGYYAATDKPDPAVITNIHRYADGLGLAFQIIDDLLDVQGDEAVLGKPVGGDEKNGKKTILTFYSPYEAEELARKCTQDAIDAIRDYPGSELLCALAQHLMKRKN